MGPFRILDFDDEKCGMGWSVHKEGWRNLLFRSVLCERWTLSVLSLEEHA